MSCISPLPRHTVLLTIIIVVSISQSVNANSQNSHLCASLQSSKSKYHNDKLALWDGSAIGNVAEEYVTAEKDWNASAVWRVNGSCSLRTCSDVYFNGNCQTFTNGTVLPASNWLSAQCKCNTNNCSCPTDFNKMSVCARAYLEDGGCSVCNAPYTELSPGSYETFPEIWSSKVSSFLVRSGCTLTVYADEDHEGTSQVISGTQVMNWTSTVVSYNCECNKRIRRPATILTPNRSSVQIVDIPDYMGDVVTKLAEDNFTHPGLLTAFSSVVRGRSPKNAYLLVLGSSGAGKSSAINILLDTSNLTLVGDETSTTSEILEFRLPAPVPSLGIGNSEVRIIDTPGLGDTGGLQNDAMFLATLDDYLSNHEELKDRIPNLVLIFHKFEDNRFKGDGAKFVRMIRALDSIRPRITDDNYSNVLFVFSHLCSAEKRDQRNPAPRLLQFKEAIEVYTFFPKPVMMTAVENRGTEYELVMRNDNFELPNGEYYPQNLFDRFDAITRRCKDPMGNELLSRESFRNSDLNNVMRITHRMVGSNHRTVTKYLNLLATSAYQLNSSEISNLLAEADRSMPVALKTNYPSARGHLSRYLALRHIRSKTDLPRSSHAILELLSGTEPNEAVAYLLDTGLNLKPPEFPVNTVAGYSFDILRNYILPVSPFDLQSKRLSCTGFTLPHVIRCTKVTPEQKAVNMLKVFNSKESYFQHMARLLLGEKFSAAANNTEIFSALTSKPNEGYFIKNMACSDGTSRRCFSVTRLYKVFTFELEPPSTLVKLLSEFTRRVRNLQPFNQSSYENVEQWREFFSDFGTHVVKSADGGGRIDVHFTLNNSDRVETSLWRRC